MTEPLPTHDKRDREEPGLNWPRITAISFAIALHIAALMLLLVPVTPPGAEQEEEENTSVVIIEPPPPPPPPPPSAARAVVRAAPKVELQQPSGFVAPIEVPDQIQPEEALDLGVEGGVVGGVEGGVPGGVVGGVVGGLPTAAPPPPARVVRIGGQIAQPRPIRRVEPVYPDLAIQSRIAALVILEAEVDTRGHVKNVKVLRGHPLFDEAAVTAVKQWRYQPLLLNGEPTGFILTVTVSFNLRSSS